MGAVKRCKRNLLLKRRNARGVGTIRYTSKGRGGDWAIKCPGEGCRGEGVAVSSGSLSRVVWGRLGGKLQLGPNVHRLRTGTLDLLGLLNEPYLACPRHRGQLEIIDEVSTCVKLPACVCCVFCLSHRMLREFSCVMFAS